MQENIEYFKYIDNFSKYKEVQSVLLFGSDQDSPLITIAIPTYKRIHLLKEAIESCLNQVDFFNYEIVIVDNDNDFTNREVINLLSKYNNDNIKYYKNEKNIGMFGNWNRCIELARGEYISILNDDDWLEKDFLKIVSSKINSKIGIFTNTKINDFREVKNKYKKNKIYNILEQLKSEKKLTLKEFFFGNKSYGSLGILFHKDSLKRIGGYNEDYYPCSDYILNSWYCHVYGGKFIKKVLCNYRIQENESMKYEVISLFPIIDEKLRKYITKILKIKENTDLIKHMKAVQIRQIYNAWNIKLNYEEKDIQIKYKVYLKIRNIIENII